MVNEELEVETTDYEVEDTESGNETVLTEEDYHKEKARREKAEKALVELKKQLKNKPDNAWNVLTEEKQALREEVSEFLLENKDLKEYKSEILKYREQGFTMKQAVALVENDDKTIENRRKTQAMNITDWETAWKTTYTKADLDDPNLSQEEYDKIMAKVRAWKIKLK